MNDPVVLELHYQLKFSDAISFDNPPPLEVNHMQFKGTLANNIFRAEMRELFPTESGARLIVDSFLKAWELNGIIESTHKHYWFEFLKSVIIDRMPESSQGNKILHAETGKLFFMGHAVEIHITRRNYPPPPNNLLYSPDVDSMIKRFEGFTKGREPLLGMAYFCLTIFESFGNDRKAVGAKFKIQAEVLTELGKLTSTRGDMLEARKFEQSSSPSLSLPEKDWVISSIKALIKRKAEYDFDPSADFPEITMESLSTK